MEPVFHNLIHPIASTRVAAAWCLRCITLAVPSQLTPLIDRCLKRLKASEAISGHSLALAALVAGSIDCKLGIPLGKPKQVRIFIFIFKYSLDFPNCGKSSKDSKSAKSSSGGEDSCCMVAHRCADFLRS